METEIIMENNMKTKRLSELKTKEKKYFSKRKKKEKNVENWTFDIPHQSQNESP